MVDIIFTKQIIEKIINYCNEIKSMQTRFGDTYESYVNDNAYRYACDMCLMQIGELASKLTENFRLKYDFVPWKKIRGMRNIFAHNYLNVNYEEAWATITINVPELEKSCLLILSDLSINNENSGNCYE